MNTLSTPYIVVCALNRRSAWKKFPCRTGLIKGVYNGRPGSYNAAPFPEGVRGDEAARLRRFDSQGLNPAPITEERFGAFPCLAGADFRKISVIRSELQTEHDFNGPVCPLRRELRAAP